MHPDMDCIFRKKLGVCVCVLVKTVKACNINMLTMIGGDSAKKPDGLFSCLCFIVSLPVWLVAWLISIHCDAGVHFAMQPSDPRGKQRGTCAKSPGRRDEPYRRQVGKRLPIEKVGREADYSKYLQMWWFWSGASCWDNNCSCTLWRYVYIYISIKWSLQSKHGLFALYCFLSIANYVELFCLFTLCSEYGHLIVSHDRILHFGSRENKCADCVFECHKFWLW